MKTVLIIIGAIAVVIFLFAISNVACNPWLDEDW